MEKCSECGANIEIRRVDVDETEIVNVDIEKLEQQNAEMLAMLKQNCLYCCVRGNGQSCPTCKLGNLIKKVEGGADERE